MTRTFSSRAWVLAGLALLSCDDRTEPDAATDAQLQVKGGQFFRGDMPGDESGPPVKTVAISPIVHPGSVGRTCSGVMDPLGDRRRARDRGRQRLLDRPRGPAGRDRPGLSDVRDGHRVLVQASGRHAHVPRARGRRSGPLRRVVREAARRDARAAPGRPARDLAHVGRRGRPRSPCRRPARRRDLEAQHQLVRAAASGRVAGAAEHAASRRRPRFRLECRVRAGRATRGERRLRGQAAERALRRARRHLLAVQGRRCALARRGVLDGVSIGAAQGSSTEYDTRFSHDRGAGVLALELDVP